MHSFSRVQSIINVLRPLFGCGQKHGDNTASHLLTGRRGEYVACRYLQALGFDVLASNVRVGGHDEIDIIAFDPEDAVLAFVEVKTRTINHPDYVPELNLTREKKRRISRAARRWIDVHDYDGGYRLDFICVAAEKVTEHYKDVPFTTAQ